MLVEAELPDGEPCSVLLQNAETVRLVGPAPARSGGGSSSSQAGGAGAAAAGTSAADDGYIWQQGGSSGGGGGGGGGASWRAVSVSELAAGDRLYVLRQGGARHTGVAIEESITER